MKRAGCREEELQARAGGRRRKRPREGAASDAARKRRAHVVDDSSEYENDSELEVEGLEDEVLASLLLGLSFTAPGRPHTAVACWEVGHA